MPALNLSQLAAPSSVSIFAKDPASSGRILAFLLTRVIFPVAGRVRLDLSESEDHRRSYQVSRNPMEPGVTGSIIRNPDTLTVQGFLSATPLGGIVAQQLGAFGSIFRRDRREVENLRTIADKREPVVVVTAERAYASMAIEAMNERHDNRTGNGIAVSLQFSEVRIVSPLLVGGMLDPDALALGAMNTASAGSQAPVEVPDPGGLG
jgi:hypothetical protein